MMPHTPNSVWNWERTDQSPPRCARTSGFVLQLAEQFAPAHIRDAFRQMVILQQVLDCQRLDTDRLVLADESGRQLVLEIPAAVGDAGVEPGHLAARLLPVLRPLLFFGVASLQAG